MKKVSVIRKSAFLCAVACMGFAAMPGIAAAGSGHSHGKTAVEASALAVTVSEAYSPAMAPGVKTAAVYLKLENGSNEPVDLIAVESKAFAMGHIHKSSMVNGLMTMEPVAQIALPAKTGVLFEPGGLHIMLMGASGSLEAGDVFPMTLVFGSGGRLEVQVAVTKPGTVPSHDHGAMQMN